MSYRGSSLLLLSTKCKEYLRRPLWNKMLQQANVDTKPWCSVGDFNVITAVDEKFEAAPYNTRKSIDFVSVIKACGLLDIAFSGNKFIWSNKRGINHTIWKRLDKDMVNDFLLENMPQTTINHLFSIGVDHCPHLMEMVSKEINHIKYFQFLNCWVDNPLFMDIVRTY